MVTIHCKDEPILLQGFLFFGPRSTLLAPEEALPDTLLTDLLNATVGSIINDWLDPADCHLLSDLPPIQNFALASSLNRL